MFKRSISISIMLALLILPTISNGNLANAAEPSCTITGTNKSEVLEGTPKKDVICGLGGNDTIKSLGGNDVIFGGAGKDKLIAGNGNDSLIGGAGADTFNGGLGQNTCTLDESDPDAVSCQLLADLGSLVTRVSGKIENVGNNLDGCYIWFTDIGTEEPGATALIQNDGEWELDAFSGEYYGWQIGRLFGDGFDGYAGENPNCSLFVNIFGPRFEVNDSILPLVIEYPGHLTGTLAVQNSAGKNLVGLSVTADTSTDQNNRSIPTSFGGGFRNYYASYSTTKADQVLKFPEGWIVRITVKGKIFGKKITRNFNITWSQTNFVVIQ